MVMQAAASKTAERQSSGDKYIEKYAGMSARGEGISFAVSGSSVRGYVPSQAGLLGLSNNRAAWQNIFQRCVSETKKKSSGGSQSDKRKALRIAQKIADGKKVPVKDEKILMDYSITLWLSAKHLASLKETQEETGENEYEEEKQENPALKYNFGV